MSAEDISLKLHHASVLRALEAANVAHGRLVGLGEVVSVLRPRDVLVIRDTYTKPLHDAVRSVLMLLKERNLVFATRGVAGRFFYGSTRVLDPALTAPPPGISCRQRTLALVREAVHFYKRAVRACDVTQYAKQAGKMDRITAKQIMQNMRGFVDTGELSIVRNVRGSSQGFNLYLPSDLPVEQFEIRQPMTWLEEVAKVFTDIWADRLREAEATGTLPHPIPTSEVRRRLKILPNPHPNLQDQRAVANALLRLATTRNPVVRQLKRTKFRSTLWIPANISNIKKSVARGFATNTERIGEAIRRAERRLRRPVTMHDVNDEIQRDPSLKQTGKDGAAGVLFNAAKLTIADGKGSRSPRRLSFVHYVGLADGSSYFCSMPPGTPCFVAAQAYVKLRQLRSRWADLSEAGQPADPIKFILPMAAVGRVLLIAEETNQIQEELKELIGSKDATADVQRGAERLTCEVAAKLSETLELLKTYHPGISEIPMEVTTAVPGLTSQELIELLYPFYPPARRPTRSHKVVGLIGDAIRRVPNPLFLSQFDKNPNRAAKYLFDRTDTLLYITIQWGGRRARVQSHTARHELGRLRDVRFILPALRSPDFIVRLTATACLAFLPEEASIKALKHVAAQDAEPNVRLSAEWALLLASGNMEKFIEGVRM